MNKKIISQALLFENIGNFVAIENGETFLNIEKYTSYFKEQYFVYISGYSNSLTREFLSLKIESYFLNKKYHNVELYKKQRARYKKEYSKESMPIINLIKKYNTVVEQEIIYETS